MSELSLLLSDCEVSEDIASARGLPAEAFRSRALLRHELKTVFAENWLLLPSEYGAQSLASLLSRPAAKVPLKSHGHSLYLHQSSQGLRAFSNICTHAWFPLVRGVEEGPRTRCGQHGRVFDEEGRCLLQPGFQGCAGFPDASDHLSAYAVSGWEQLYFVAQRPTMSLREVLGPLQESLGRFPLDRLRRVSVEQEERIVAGNWKQHAWNYMDKFHIPYIHGGRGGLIDRLMYKSYTTELYERSALQWAWAKDPAHGFAEGQISGRFSHPERRVLALWWFVFPNLTLNFYPWGLSVNRYEPHEEDPQRTRFFWEHWVCDEEKYALRDEIWLSEQVDQEDVEALALVGSSIQSSLEGRGRFALGEEEGPHWFHRLVSRSLLGHSV
jgi:choline monooxygenase